MFNHRVAYLRNFVPSAHPLLVNFAHMWEFRALIVNRRTLSATSCYDQISRRSRVKGIRERDRAAIVSLRARTQTVGEAFGFLLGALLLTGVATSLALI
jgi:hypothetical protein